MPSIKAENLRKEFFDVLAVKDICFTVEKGEIFGLIGPNGAGKTTTIRMLATSLKPTSGTAFINGLNILNDEIAIRNIIGFMPDFFAFYKDLTVEELLDYFGHAHGIQPARRKMRIDDVLAMTNLENKRKNFVNELSRGMMQRLCFARAIIHEPEILLLDEPASGLDPKARIELRDNLKKLSKKGVTVFISSHILTELSDVCTSVGIMEKGVLVEYGPIAKIVQKISLPLKVRLDIVCGIDAAIATLQSDAMVSGLEQEGNSLSFIFKGTRENIAQLNEKLVAQHVGISGIRQEGRELEDIFMKISTGETA